MIFDSHAHYDSEQFDIDRDELLGSVLPQKGVVAVINMAADYESLKKTVALCEKYDYIYGAVGIHPECANDLPDNWLSDVEALLSHPKIVAVGGAEATKDSLFAAVTAARDAKSPVTLLTEKNGRYRTVTLDWTGGLRFPHLDPVGAGPRALDAALSPRRP